MTRSTPQTLPPQEPSRGHWIARAAGLLLALTFVIGLHAHWRIERFGDAERTLTVQSVRNAEQELTARIQRLQQLARLFVEEQHDAITALAARPDDTDLRSRLAAKAAAYFPGYFALSIADWTGLPLLPDPDLELGRRCRADITAFARGIDADPPPVHTPSMHFQRTEGGYWRHFDIMSAIGAERVFFISITADSLRDILRRHQLPGQRLRLLSGNEPVFEDLATDSGVLPEPLPQPFDPLALRHPVLETPIAGTVWRLHGALDETVMAQRRLRILAETSALWAITAALLALVWSWLNHERQRGQEIAEINDALSAEIAERQRTELRLRELSLHDPLTGLSNRRTAEESLERMLALARRAGTHTGVLFLDIDEFKGINDSLGHGYGDLVIKEIAQRLQQLTRGADLVARWGGDEFLLITGQLAQPEAAAAIAEKLNEAMRTTLRIGGQELRATISIGVAVAPGDGDDAETLARNADTALYVAKQQGRNRYQVFRPEMHEAAQARLNLEQEIRRGLRLGEFAIQVEPRFRLSGNHLSGAYARLVWNHPSRGVVPPEEFWPLAEQCDLDLLLQERLLLEIRHCLEGWRLGGQTGLICAFALTSRDLARTDLLAWITGYLGQDAAGHVEIILSGASIPAGDTALLTALRRLRDAGLRLACDPFVGGDQQLSLACLSRLPITTVRLSTGFVAGLAESAPDRDLAATLVSLYHDLGLTVLAEGVTTTSQRDLLRNLGVDEATGPLFGPAVPAEEFAKRFHGHPPQVA